MDQSPLACLNRIASATDVLCYIHDNDGNADIASLIRDSIRADLDLLDAVDAPPVIEVGAVEEAVKAPGNCHGCARLDKQGERAWCNDGGLPYGARAAAGSWRDACKPSGYICAPDAPPCPAFKASE